MNKTQIKAVLSKLRGEWNEIVHQRKQKEDEEIKAINAKYLTAELAKTKFSKQLKKDIIENFTHPYLTNDAPDLKKSDPKHDISGHRGKLEQLLDEIEFDLLMRDSGENIYELLDYYNEKFNELLK